MTQSAVGPAEKYFAKTDAKTHSWPSKGLDITKDLRGHANVVVVQWSRTQKNGTWTLTIGTTNTTVKTTHVTPSSPAKGKQSKPFIAPQAKIGR